MNTPNRVEKKRHKPRTEGKKTPIDSRYELENRFDADIGRAPIEHTTRPVPDALGFGESGFRTSAHKFQKATPETPYKKSKTSKRTEYSLHKGERVLAKCGRCADSRKDVGKGNFARVFLIIELEGPKHALKVLKPVVKNSNFSIEQLKKRANYEFEVRRKVPDHENLVTYRALAQTSDYVGILMELCEGGTLERFVTKDNFGTLPRNSTGLLIQILKQVITGLDFMHKHNVLHLDIKPDNILLTQPFVPGIVPVIKIGDFGTAVDTTAMETQDPEDIETGDPRYAAPETVYGGDRKFDGRADVYSVGVLMVQLVTQLEPTDTAEKHFPSNFRIDPAEFESAHELECHNLLVETIKRMLERDPNKRITTSQILESWHNLPKSPLLIDSVYPLAYHRWIEQSADIRHFAFHTRSHSESSSSLGDEKGT